jgi:hypothetical protein
MKLDLITCVSRNKDYVGLNHIYEAWEAAGYVNRVYTPMLADKRYIAWVGRVGGLALEPSDVKSIGTPYEYVLACQYNSAFKDMKNVLPWNFYVRNWPEYRRARLNMPAKRTIQSIFSGTIRGRGMGKARNQWMNSTEVFGYSPAGRYTRTNLLYPTIYDYYTALGASKFALCPVGDCPICQRESETLGMGCVGMYTPGVEWQYAVSPVENRDFITVKDVADMKMRMETMKKDEIEAISRNAMAYFDRACTPEALWGSVLRAIDTHEIKVD